MPFSGDWLARLATATAPAFADAGGTYRRADSGTFAARRSSDASYAAAARKLGDGCLGLAKLVASKSRATSPVAAQEPPHVSGIIRFLKAPEATLEHWLSALLVLAPMQAFASPPSEWQQRLACTGDAFRLCNHDIPDRAKIRSCMMREHDHLSEGCRHVFDASVAAGD